MAGLRKQFYCVMLALYSMVYVLPGKTFCQIKLPMESNCQPSFGEWCREDFEPFGAEDFGSEDQVPSIPEPMVFDLVRPLGADKGELEINVLGLFPFSTNADPAPADFDPFGFAPSSVDRDEAEWAPEIEYALFDGFAIEFELPFEGGTLEAYKFAAQLTFGTLADNTFIHGTQVIIEPDKEFDDWNMTFLYVAGKEHRFNFSSLAMFGVRTQSEEGRGVEYVDGIFNYILFKDISPETTIGLENNLVFGERDRTTYLLMPQFDHEITDHMQIQFGTGVGFSVEGTEALAGTRLIFSR